ncbi:hypothetical protein FBEOM_11098 [Fusarium beomiforme]|uniref:Uncharacterized protein n=1 Tax=Fusarium beomiforme TaxID=44412 RepID=A0A9P5AA36_9HYPO|nr:hypothetical protein FBEOM_11098 [Fusarium beomiforme]
MRVILLLALFGTALSENSDYSTQRCSTSLGPLSVEEAPTATATDEVQSIVYKRVCHPKTNTVTPDAVTSTNTSTVTFTATASASNGNNNTTTIMSFTPVALASGYLARKRNISKKRFNNKKDNEVDDKDRFKGYTHDSVVYPQAVECIVVFKNVTTKTVEACQKSTETTTLLQSPSVFFCNVTEAVTSIVSSALGTSTATNMVTTTITPITTVTHTIAQNAILPVSFVFDACYNYDIVNNPHIIGTANGGHGISETDVGSPELHILLLVKFFFFLFLGYRRYMQSWGRLWDDV